jgi:hypothetical protein
VTAAAEAPSGSWRQQGERARDLATQQRAVLVVWVVEMDAPPDATKTPSRRTFVAVYLATADRLYAHPIGPPLSSSSLDQHSASLELAALTTRAALRSLDEPEALGMPLGEVATAEPPTPAPPSETPALPAPEPPSPEPSPVPLDGVLALGTALDDDGLTGLGIPTLRVAVGLERRSFRALLAGEWTPLQKHTTTDARLGIERLFVGFEAQLEWVELGRGFTSYAALSLGATAFHRRTEVTGPTVSATAPNTTWSPKIAGLLALAWDPRLQWLDQRLGLRAGVGFVPSAPVIELEGEASGAADTRRFPLARLEPFIGVEWMALF